MLMHQREKKKKNLVEIFLFVSYKTMIPYTLNITFKRSSE